MEIKSSAFKDGGRILPQYTCDGENIIPPLEFVGMPKMVKSLALIVDDPDSFAGVWGHWIIWNINPAVTEIKEGIVPDGAIEGNNSFDNVGYGGPCPKEGEHHKGTAFCNDSLHSSTKREHRYFFKLYALDSMLEVSPDIKKDDLQEEMTRHVIEQAEMVGMYSRG